MAARTASATSVTAVAFGRAATSRLRPTYLGLTVPQLLQKLANGKSLADVAKAQRKSVDGLKKAIVDGARRHLDQAVKSGS